MIATAAAVDIIPPGCFLPTRKKVQRAPHLTLTSRVFSPSPNRWLRPLMNALTAVVASTPAPPPRATPPADVPPWSLEPVAADGFHLQSFFTCPTFNKLQPRHTATHKKAAPRLVRAAELQYRGAKKKQRLLEASRCAKRDAMFLMQPIECAENAKTETKRPPRATKKQDRPQGRGAPQGRGTATHRNAIDSNPTRPNRLDSTLTPSPKSWEHCTMHLTVTSYSDWLSLIDDVSVPTPPPAPLPP